eukprot:2808887-Amphidinium_carterae.1
MLPARQTNTGDWDSYQLLVWSFGLVWRVALEAHLLLVLRSNIMARSLESCRNTCGNTSGVRNELDTDEI